MDGQDWKAAHEAQVAEDIKADNAAKELDNARQKLAALVADNETIQADLQIVAFKKIKSLLTTRTVAGKSHSPTDVGALWEAIKRDCESSVAPSSANSILETLSSHGLSDDEAAQAVDKIREFFGFENLDDPSTSANVRAERVRRLRDFHGATQSEEWLTFFESLSLKRVTLLDKALREHATDQELDGLLDDRMLAVLRQLEPLLGDYLEFVSSKHSKNVKSARSPRPKRKRRTKTGSRRGKRRGRPNVTPEEAETRKVAIANWSRAKSAGKSRRQFCDDETELGRTITPDTLERYVNWNTQAQTRKAQKRG